MAPVVIRDRMLYSALNFAIGFFGYPHQDKYLQSITIEALGVRSSKDAQDVPSQTVFANGYPF